MAVSGPSSSANSQDVQQKDEWNQAKLEETSNGWRSNSSVSEGELDPQTRKIVGENILGPMMIELAKQQNPTKNIDLDE